MSQQVKPCQYIHGDFKEGCDLCRKWRDSPRFAKHRGETGAAPMPKRKRDALLPGSSLRDTKGIVPVVKQRSCQKKCQWAWAVLLDGVVKDSGECETENEARAEAEQSAAELRDLLGPSITRGEYEWVTSARLAAESLELVARLPSGLCGVAGIPRSGMTPATLIASHLHLPLYELTASGRLNRLGNGSRGVAAANGGPILVVDDTVFSGAAMRRARTAMRTLKREAVYAAVYCRPETAQAVDFHARLLPSPHLLEWNLVNCAVLAGNSIDPVFGKGVALDLDGVIVHDAQSGGPLLSPYLVPRSVTAPLIVTGRSEVAREETEALLRAVGAKWARLEMLPAGVPLTAETAAAHKARHYAESGCGFFLESCPVQAELIHRTAGKPVICPVAGKVWG